MNSEEINHRDTEAQRKKEKTQVASRAATALRIQIFSFPGSHQAISGGTFSNSLFFTSTVPYRDLAGS